MARATSEYMNGERRDADTRERRAHEKRDLGVADTVVSLDRGDQGAQDDGADHARGKTALTGRHERSESLVGTFLARRYKFLQLLGSGGMGAVYLARDHALDELIAIKMLHQGVAASNAAIEFLRHEVRLARRVTHRNVARIFEFGEDEGHRFLTMEYVDGESVASMLRTSGRIPPRRAVEILRSVCHGLSAVHEAGIVHRDIKPDNVLVSRSGRVVLSDFGIAWAAQSGVGSGVGALRAGTPAYMAPEQLAGLDVTTRSDVYSLGVMAFEMLAGELPWRASEARTGEEDARRTIVGPPDPRALVDDIPHAMAHLVMRTMEPEAERRVASPAEFAQELDAIFTREHQTRETPLYVSVAPSVGQKSKVGVAVLPFENRGAADDDYLASGFAEDLIDCLSGVPELRVLSRGAMARFADDPREAHEIGRELGVDVVVGGSLQRTGEAVLVRARAIETREGVQRWSKRARVPAEDLLMTSDDLAESLAAALAPSSSENPAGESAGDGSRSSALPTAAAMEVYLKARESYRTHAAPSDTVALYEQALELAPESPMVHAGYAMTLLRIWLMQSMAQKRDTAVPIGRAIPTRAQDAAERAIALDPNLGEPHLAMGLVALHQGESANAIREFRTTLALAPSTALAHAFLGEVLAEMGRVPEAMRRLDTASRLDPSNTQPNHARRRTIALLGQWERAYELARGLPPPTTPLGWYLTLRVAAYRGDRELLRHILDELARMENDPYSMKHTMMSQAEVYLGLRAGKDVYHLLQPPGWLVHTSKRGRANRYQVLAETAGFAGDTAVALDAIESAVALGFFDLLWLERCPLLDSLRPEARFAELHARIQERCHTAYDALWT